MNSLRAKATSHEEQQAAIRAQILALQAQLDPDTVLPSLEEAKEKENRSNVKRVLVGESPVKSATKKRKVEQVQPVKPPLLARPVNAVAHPLPGRTTASTSTPSQPVNAKPSKILTTFHSLHSQPEHTAEPEQIQRSSAFDAPPPALPALGGQQKRDENLQIVEELEPGPREFKPLPDDPHFERLEPNSGIRLSARRVAHEDIQSYLSGRFYLPPSLLYSVARLTADKQGYDIPVSGDWVTIAVVAERGDVKISRGGVRKEGDIASSDEEGAGGGKKTWREKVKQRELEKERAKAGGSREGKKYITLKLVDFGNKPSGGGGTGSSKGASMRGDAMLSLLLFEANQVREEEDRETEGGTKKLYKGGSGGAFEVWAATLREGSVVALLNPRVLRPFQGGDSKPHPTNNILALTPNTAESITVIGQSLDLARCAARRKDGTQCNGWCDRRVNDACEYHIQQRVKSLRASRPEFAVGTSGFTTARPNAGPNFQKKQGLLPSKHTGIAPPESGGGPTYIMEGHVLRSNARAAPQEYVGEKLGRERAERDIRKTKRSKAEEELKDLLSGKGTKLTISGHKIGRATTSSAAAGTSGSEGEEKERKVRTAFRPDTVKKIGFNPAFMGLGGQAEVNRRKAEAKNRDVHALLVRRDVQSEPKLRGPPGAPKIRSGVSVPAHLADPPAPAEEDKGHESLSDLELMDGYAATGQASAGRQDEDDSSDLEIEGSGPIPIPVIKRKSDGVQEGD